MPRKIVHMVVLVAAAPIGSIAVAQVLSMQPGQWEIVSTTTSVDMPGAPPAVANMMRGRSMTIKHCVTPQEVADGPQAAMKNNKSCTVSYHMGMGGKFTSEMVCKQGASTTTATSSGTMSPTSFSSTGKMVMSGPQAMTIMSTATGHKVGECKG